MPEIPDQAALKVALEIVTVELNRLRNRNNLVQGGTLHDAKEKAKMQTKYERALAAYYLLEWMVTTGHEPRPRQEKLF